MKPWIARQTIISSIDVDGPHISARHGEAGGRCGEQGARAERPRQKARQRDHDDFGDQIGRLHPGDLVELAASPAWISVNEAETIWMSRIAMNMPNTMQRKANSRRGSI